MAYAVRAGYPSISATSTIPNPQRLDFTWKHSQGCVIHGARIEYTKAQEPEPSPGDGLEARVDEIEDAFRKLREFTVAQSKITSEKRSGVVGEILFTVSRDRTRVDPRARCMECRPMTPRTDELLERVFGEDDADLEDRDCGEQEH